MSRHLRHPKYTYQKDNIYYFSRSVSVDLRSFYKKPRIVQSLKTSSPLKASNASKVFASKLDDYWLGLRLKQIDVPAAHLLINGLPTNDVSLQTIEEALAIYLSVKGKVRQDLFFISPVLSSFAKLIGSILEI